MNQRRAQALKAPSQLSHQYDDAGAWSGRERVDHATFVAALSARLRADGIGVSIAPTERLARALALCTPNDVASLYWITRTCVLNDRSEITTFDATFRSIFGRWNPPHISDQPSRAHGPAPAPRTGSLRISAAAPRISTQARHAETSGRFIVQEPIKGRRASDEAEVLDLLPSERSDKADTPFDQLNPADLKLLTGWLDGRFDELLTRRSRRRGPDGRSADIDLRRTLMAARSTGGEPMRISYRRQRRLQRRVVTITDVSGSMRVHSRLHLHLARALVLRVNAEAFTISTSLRRVTTQLRHTDNPVAIDRLAEEVVDRFGGTKIGASLRQLLTSPIWSNTVRGAVVVIASDGWDADPPELLGESMQRLSRMAHKVIWVNPRARCQRL